MLTLRRPQLRTVLAFSHDVVAAGLAWMGAFWLRFNLELPEPYAQTAWTSLIWVVPVQALIFWRFGLYRGIWRYASLPDLKRILFAVFVAAMAAPIVLFMLKIPVVLPRSVLLLDPLLLVIFMGGSRLSYRAWKEHRLYGLREGLGKPVLVLGAGDAAVSLLKELSRSHEWRVVGLLDDAQAKHGRLLNGVKVFGSLNEVALWSKRLSVQHCIIAMPSVSSATRRRVVKLCTQAGLNALTVPSLDDLMSRKVHVSQVRNIEIDDLLGREAVVLDDPGLHRLLTDKSVLVSGAGGSIGAELCRQIVTYQPRRLILFELNELALYSMEQELSGKFPEIEFIYAIGDVKNRTRLSQVLKQYAPNVIFHAAAYKHVPLMEEGNAYEALQNNVAGTYALAQEAIAHKVEKFVLISTDKAVNPVNVMGASKRLAEMVCQGLQAGSETRFVMVRFGNVLGSTGSVIPKFRAQIAKGGPVTVTHADVTRYFMSLSEAAQLVLQAGLMGKGGEIFVMDMGEPVKIADLARDMIRLSGFNEDEIKIVYTGLRNGEKLYEELLTDDEQSLPTPHTKLRIAQARPVHREWVTALAHWLNRTGTLNDNDVRMQLGKWLPEYLNNENIEQKISASA